MTIPNFNATDKIVVVTGASKAWDARWRWDSRRPAPM